MGDDFAPPEKADAPFDWRKALSDRAQWLVVFIVGVSVARLTGQLMWVTLGVVVVVVAAALAGWLLSKRPRSSRHSTDG